MPFCPSCVQFLHLAALVREQRAGKPDSWAPTEDDLADVMRKFSESKNAVAAPASLSDHHGVWRAVAAGTVVVAAVLVMRMMWQSKPSR
jgi:hypothetical protein